MHDDREVKVIYTGTQASEDAAVELLCQALYSLISEEHEEGKQRKAG